jgi:hypothetical protein
LSISFFEGRMFSLWIITNITCFLGCVVCLTTGPNGHGFKPSRGDGFLMAINIRSTPSFGWEVKPEVPCRKRRSVDVSKILSTRNFHSFVHSSYLLQISLLVGLPESCGRQVMSYPQFITTLTFTRGMNSRPVMAAFWEVSLTTS